jgi:hypothetical protein
MSQNSPERPALTRIIAYVASRPPEEPARYYGMMVTLAADLDDGRRIHAGGFGFGGPRKGTAAIWHRYRGPQLSEDPEENERLLRETYQVGLPDIKDAINQMLGRDPDQHRPPRLSWNHLLDALVEVGIEIAEEELIALPIDIELSDQVRAEIARS